MFEQVLESLRKATDATVQMQQDLYRKWVSFWPGLPAAQACSGEQVQQVQKKWAEFVSEVVKRQRAVLEAQFKEGLQNLEKSFQLLEARDPEEMRARTVELWQKSFDCLRRTYEAQLRETQELFGRWADLVLKQP